MLVLAKGLSSGYAPLAAILLKDKVFQKFEETKSPYIGGHTYNCHPVTASVGLSVLDYIQKNRLMESVPQKGESLHQGLLSIANRSAIVGNVRGKGLMWGLEFVADKKTRQPFEPGKKIAHRVVAEAMNNGLIVYPVTGCADGARGDGVLICPPLVINDEEITFLVEQLDKTLAKICREIGG